MKRTDTRQRKEALRVERSRKSGQQQQQKNFINHKQQWSAMLQEGFVAGCWQSVCSVSWGLGGDGGENRKSRPQVKW